MAQQKKHRGVRRAILILVAALVVVCALPPRKVNVFSFLPQDAVAVGYHKDIRATWKRQLSHPAVAALLAGLGEDPAKMAREDGVFWTFLLAVGRDVASALLVESDPASPTGRLVLAAASPADRRNLLLSFFWKIRWVPGLGRILTDSAGRHYIDLADEDDPDASPLVLSVAFGGGVLRVKLSSCPEDMSDMDGSCGRAGEFAALLQENLPEGFRHRVAIVGDRAQGIFPFLHAGSLDIVSDKDAVGLYANLSPVTQGLLGELLPQKLKGVNTPSSALAGYHAFAFALLPSPFTADVASRLIDCKRTKSAAEDAAIYLTSAPYGAKFMIFDIPAVTASIPSISTDAESLRKSLAHALPKQLRATVALQGDSTICSSAASLNAQGRAAPPPPRTWRDAYPAVADESTSVFLYIVLDPFCRELRQIANAILFSASFARDSFDPALLDGLRDAEPFIPRLPTDLTLAASLGGDASDCRIRLVLSR